MFKKIIPLISTKEYDNMTDKVGVYAIIRIMHTAAMVVGGVFWNTYHKNPDGLLCFSPLYNQNREFLNLRIEMMPGICYNTHFGHLIKEVKKHELCKFEELIVNKLNTIDWNTAVLEEEKE
jgi:hypothetical protein